MYTMGDRNYPVSSVKTTFHIIEALNELGEGGITEIAASTNMSNSTVHKHLNTLRSLGYVRKNDTTYALSLRFLGIGTHARSQYDIVRVAKPFVDDLSMTTGAITNLILLEHGYGVYAYRSSNSVEADEALPIIGEPIYLHTTTVGKTILSELDWKEVREIIDNIGFPEVMEQTISSRPAHRQESQSTQNYSESRRGRTIFQLKQELRSIQNQGFATERGEHGQSFQVAAPIAIDGRPVAAISVSSEIEHASEMESEEVADLVTNTANEIESELVQE